MRVIDRTPLIKKYPGKWLALKQDCRTVVAVGGTVVRVLKEARKKGYRDPVLTRMPKKLIAFVGGYRLTA